MRRGKTADDEEGIVEHRLGQAETLRLAVLGDQGDPGRTPWRAGCAQRSHVAVHGMVSRVNGAHPEGALDEPVGAPGSLQAGDPYDLAGPGDR